MATKLNQIIAIRKGVLAQFGRWRDAAYHTAQKDALFAGLSRTYQPRDEDGEQLPAESTRVQVTAQQILDEFAANLTRMWDVTLTLDEANTHARADLAVGGVTLLKDVPATFLLFLEKQLVDVRTMISKMPVLDPAQDWTWDDARDCYANPEPVRTTRSRKVPRNHVKAEATDRHPAQVEVYMENEIVGDWSLTNFSGAMPAARKHELLRRVEDLLTAVKFAREAANNTEVTDQVAGKPVFDWLYR